MTDQFNLEALGGQLYSVYCTAVGGKAFSGEPLPDWQIFRADPSKQLQSEAWMRVAAVQLMKGIEHGLWNVTQSQFEENKTRQMEALAKGMDSVARALKNWPAEGQSYNYTTASMAATKLLELAEEMRQTRYEVFRPPQAAS